MKISLLRPWMVFLLCWPVLDAGSFAQQSQTAGMNEGETVADAAVKENNAMAKIEDVPGLPRVLLIGDSISIAYTLPVRELLRGKANVHRAPVNCQNSKMGLSGTQSGPKSWLGEGKWDVIHFNFGLWDARLNASTGMASVPGDQYRENLLEIVQRLQATGARVIFATTTPVPKSLLTVPVPGPLPPKTRLFEDVRPRNELAVQALKEKGVVINDLYGVIFPVVAEHQRSNDVHFTKEGSELLAKAVTERIESQLPKASP